MKTKTNTTTFSRKVAISITGILITLMTVVSSGAPASAWPSPGPGTYSGDQCQHADWSRGLLGGRGCIFLNSGGTSNRQFSISAGAYDGGNDGHSVRTDVLVEQSVNGRWLVTNKLRATVQRGQGFSQVGNAVTIYQYRGHVVASQVRIRLQVCVYDDSSNTNVRCTVGRPVQWQWNSSFA